MYRHLSIDTVFDICHHSNLGHMAFHKPHPATQGCRNKNLFVNHILLHSDTCSHGGSEGPTYEKDILAKNDQNGEKKKHTLAECSQCT